MAALWNHYRIMKPVKTRSATLFLLILTILIACSREKDGPPPLPPPAKISEISQDEIQNLMKLWLASQNNGDFSSYQSLYANRFTGIRRTGHRETSFDREGWMRDRKRMFEKPMRVEAHETNSSIAGITAVVRFEQRWMSASYQDAGPKQMVLAKEKNGELRIAREEMLGSNKMNAQRSEDRKFSYIVEEGIVLDFEPSLEWGSGPLQLTGTHNVRQKVNPKTLPAETKDLLRKSFKLMNNQGEVCETKITDFFLLKRVVPHFGNYDRWKEEGTPKATIAQEIWDMGDTEGFLLMGDVKICKGATWARAAYLPSPTLIPAKPAPDAWRETALKEFRKLPAYQEIQQEFLKNAVEGKATGLWENYNDGKTIVSFFSFPQGQSPWIAVSARSVGSCNDFEGNLWAIWEIRGGPTHAQFKPLNDPENGVCFKPEAIVDLDGDHQFEILFKEFGIEPTIPIGGIVYQKDGLFQEVEEYKIPYYDCGC